MDFVAIYNEIQGYRRSVYTEPSSQLSYLDYFEIVQQHTTSSVHECFKSVVHNEISYKHWEIVLLQTLILIKLEHDQTESGKSQNMPYVKYLG